jgi:hypothetical protein
MKRRGKEARYKVLISKTNCTKKVTNSIWNCMADKILAKSYDLSKKTFHSWYSISIVTIFIALWFKTKNKKKTQTNLSYHVTVVHVHMFQISRSNANHF